MNEFLNTISKYPKFLFGLVAGVILNALAPFVPLLKRPVSAIAVIGFFVAALACLSFTLRAMLGLDPF